MEDDEIERKDEMNLFYASTAYHVLLCYILAFSECGNDENTLLLLGNNAANKTAELLCKLFPKAFANIVQIDSYTDHNNIKRFLCKKKVLKQIKTELGKLPEIRKFYYSCDWKIDVEYISYLLKDTSVEYHFYDDGIGTYLELYKADKSFLGKLFSKLYYGSWRVEPKAAGLLNKAAVIHTMWPELLPPVYDSSKKCRVNADKLLQNVESEKFPENLTQFSDINIEYFLALPTVDEMNNAFIEFMKNYVISADKNKMTGAIKNHPRTRHNDPVLKKININGTLINLPQEYPAEIYYIVMHRTLKKVVSLASTAVMTAKILLPSVEVVVPYTAKSVETNKKTQKELELFGKIGIKLTEFSD